MQNSLQLPSGYHEFLQELKGRIRTAQVRAALAVNRELVLLYWSIGRDILAKQGTEGWGTRIIDRLAHDLQNEFPGIEGFSPGSLKYMRALAEAWPERTICATAYCTTALGAQCARSGPNQGPADAGVVPPGSAGAWLEPKCPGSYDLRTAPREGREGAHQL